MTIADLGDAMDEGNIYVNVRLAPSGTR